ncbi:MAG: hypothetical protein H6591_11640 [Flavobacteriales bacterium]|nr:hypothetical protein [Flavobacteriales bacterium]
MHWERWNQSPEYFHACAGSLGGVDTLIRVPSNGFGFQYALHGDAYVGMYAYATSGGGVNYREYVGCQLLEPLEVGESYDLSFYTNVAVDGSYWWTRWACSNMGMLFTMQPNIWSGSSGPLFAFRNYAHLRSTEVISDTANWTLVSGSFVADSAYQFLVLGNFFNNALTDTLHIVPGNSLGAYYFVDGVCVGRSGQPCEFITGIEKPDFDSPMVWPNPVSEQVQVRTGAGTAWHVFDVTGRLMASGVSATEFMVLSVQDWAPGEYSMMLQGEGRRRIRFVVMR